MRTRWPLVVLIFAPLALLWRCVFLGETIGPWAEVRAFAPWSETPPGRPFDVLQMDAALQFYVWRDLVFDSWRHFQVPIWNPYSFGGAPLLANSQSGALYPPHVLVGVLQLPTSAGVTLLAWFHLSLAGIGVFTLGRRLGGNEWIACICGVTFALSPFMASWTGLSSVISTVAWIPWCLLLLWRILEHDKPRLGSVLLALCIAMMLLAGHLQFAAFGLMALVVFWMVAAWELRPKLWLGFVPGISLILGSLLASPQLIAVLEYSRESHRRTAPTIEGWQAYQASGLQWWEWASMGASDLLGHPQRWGPFGENTTFWPSFVKPGGNYAESAVAVGTVVLMLALGSLKGRQKGSFSLAIVVLLGFLVASASFFARGLYFYLPGWSATGSPGRAGVLVVLGLCLLAASCPPPDRNLIPGWVAGAAVAILGLLSLVYFGPSLKSWLPELTQDQVSRIFWIEFGHTGGPILILASIAALLWSGRSRPNLWVPISCSMGLIFVLMSVSTSPLRTGSVPAAPEGLPTNARVAIINREWSLFSQPRALMPPNLAALYRIQEVGGYDSLVSRDRVEHLRRLNLGTDPAPPENGNMMFLKEASQVTRADADEVWTLEPIPSWESRLLGKVGTAYRYKVNTPGQPSVQEKPRPLNWWGSAVALCALILLGLKGPRKLA
ncbi:MAG: hypothetical protein JNK63_03355 [Chthonomonas sp.]|nr:hypothetical protein [Chthonomonas sp.]